MLLAIDTSTRVVGVALYDGKQVLGEVIWAGQDYHTVELAPVVAELLGRTKVSVSDLKVLAVALGPGSFTGLRIGLALAKGMALARHLALVGIPSLDVIAAAQPVRELPMAAVLRVGRGRLGVGWYKSEKGAWKSTGNPEVLTAEALADRLKVPTLVCGELTDEERHQLARKRRIAVLATPAQSLRRPSYLAELAWRCWQAGRIDDPTTLVPFYLHFSEPTLG
ncbi:MAG TPA: tRNA (adenosine(37)-N6)-threonylcarbamoyltransferase complex dimerization subunit type 1 TsaB [Anaerolineales bacterium]|nr:tRNA (adenosine(37)-N6)-threonylcarbamoyltransferase complex dimerization subunit type 1 TsaB [Anaerolineales bacterium]